MIVIDILPKSLHAKLQLFIILTVAVPTLFAGHLMIVQAEDALVAEKQNKLFGMTHVLDRNLHGTFDDILRRRQAENASREEKIALLNEELQKDTDEVAEAYPGSGVGYYDKDLDAIITYGPSHIYSDKVGLPISVGHEGRIVMDSGLPRVQEGDLVRGAVMNAMYPIVRDGRVIGYIWANEFTSDIQDQIAGMKWHAYMNIIAGLLLGIAGVVFLINRFMADIDIISEGLLKLKNDLNYRMPVLTGEMGTISLAINEMAHGLVAQKKLEAQVQRAERLAGVGEVAAGLAHEIRNPLMAIRGFAQLAGEETDSATKKEYLAIIMQEADRMNRLIEQLLYLARPQDTCVTLVDVNAVLENTLLLVETQSIRRHIGISLALDMSIPKVRVDAEQMKQVLLNIVINALQAMDGPGQITIDSHYDAGQKMVCVAIGDTGKGIDPVDIPKLFDPFFTTKDNGTGLGLSVAQRLMENWDGKILVESKLGQGSKFTLVFPAAEGVSSHE